MMEFKHLGILNKATDLQDSKYEISLTYSRQHADDVIIAWD